MFLFKYPAHRKKVLTIITKYEPVITSKNEGRFKKGIKFLLLNTPHNDLGDSVCTWLKSYLKRYFLRKNRRRTASYGRHHPKNIDKQPCVYIEE
jgi:hypothetical protein